MKNSKLKSIIYLFLSIGALAILLYEVAILKYPVSNSYMFVMLSLVFFLLYTFQKRKIRLEEEEEFNKPKKNYKKLPGPKKKQKKRKKK